MATIINDDGNIAFFGRVSWGNFLDWLVTLCAGAIIVCTTVSLGGVRPETHLTFLPLFLGLIVLHGLWLALDRDSPKSFSQIPLFFVPALLWMLGSVLWVTPVPWRGWYEMVYTLQAFIMLWVLSNNVRTRSHLWVLIVISLTPALVAVFYGFFQFFQKSDELVRVTTEYDLQLSPEFLGRATGAFADPNAFSVFLLVLLPALLIAAAVKRLPIIFRALSLYIALMFIVCIALTKSYWAIALAVVLAAIVPWFCFRRIKRRLLFSILGLLVASLAFWVMANFHSSFKEGFRSALTEDGEGVRLVLWEEALNLASENPLTGVGAGAYGAAFEQSPRVAMADRPITPHNDYLLILSQLGFVGAVLFGAPCLFVFLRAFGRWRKEPYEVTLSDTKEKVMSPQRFFLSLGLTGSIAFALCLALTFVFYVPALTLYGVLFLSILVKNSFSQGIKGPEHQALRIAYFLLATVVAVSYYLLCSNKLEGQALEMRARQQLEHVIDTRVHVSGNVTLLDQVIQLYEDAVFVDPKNADAWIGLSASNCQLYFRSPSSFEDVSGRAVACAERAIELSPEYWNAWSQLGVALSFYGEAERAEEALLKALELAPNSSNAHYYYGAFLSAEKSRHEQALSSVRQALQINPGNSAARRLQQKLLIF